MKTRHCASTDPRDKVYALLPLLSKAVRDSKLTPNYGLSLAVVPTDTETYLMEHWGVEILCEVQRQSQRETLGLRQTQLPFVQSFRAGGDFNPNECPVTQL